MLFRLLLACALSCCVTLTAWAAPASFLGSGELLKNRHYGFAKASNAEIEATIKRLPSGFSMTPYLRDKDIHWYRHSGDLVLDRSLSNGHALIVEGNLRIQGSYDDYRDSTGLLVVLGDMHVDNVTSWGSLAVGGRLQASGLVFAYYNDFTFDATAVSARALFIYDKSGSVGKVDAPISFSSWNGPGKGGVQRALQSLMPEIVLPALDDEERLEYGFYPDFRQIQQRVAAGEPLFRSQPGPETLLADLKLAIAERLSAAQFDALVGKDRLLAGVLAQREDLKPNWQTRLLATRDPFVLDTLARNKTTSTAVLEQIAGVSASLASVVMANPNAPRTLVGKLAKEGSVDVRRASAERANLAADQVALLAKDRDASVRIALIGANGHRLSADSIALLATDADAEVRLALLENSLIPLDAAQLGRLAKDARKEIRAAVAERLAGQASWKQKPDLPAAQREALAAGLADDADERVALQASAALSPAEQERRWLAAKPGQKEALANRLAKSTRSERIQTEIAALRDKYILQELASNLALWPSVQSELLRKLQPAKRRPAISILDHDAMSKAMDGPEGTVARLMENDNAMPAAIEQAAQYCAETLGKAFFCSALTHRKDLSPKVIEILRTAYRGEEREDLALTITLQPGASEAQIKWAVPVWMDDEDELLAEFKPIQKREGEAFWLALASARNPKLRELAATNAQTPAAALLRLTKDKAEDVASSAWSNPALPAASLEALSLDRLAELPLNPTLSSARIEALLALAIAKNDTTQADYCLEKLAARALRQPPKP